MIATTLLVTVAGLVALLFVSVAFSARSVARVKPLGSGWVGDAGYGPAVFSENSDADCSPGDAECDCGAAE